MASEAVSDKPWATGLDCVVCGHPVDTGRGTQSPALMWAHQMCVRRWADLLREVTRGD